MPFLKASLLLLAAAFLASHFGGPHYFLDNLSNFPVHFALAFLACAAGFVLGRQPRWAAGAAAGIAVSLLPVVPWYCSAAEAGLKAAAPVRVLVSNVYLRNRRHRAIRELVASENPDVVALVEVNAHWLQKLAPLRERYPHHFEMPDEQFAGLAMYSRFPLEHARALQLAEAPQPVIAATLRTPAGDVELVVAHPASPGNAEDLRRRNAQLRALARYVGESRLPVVLVGDLNVTMWNRNYRPLVAEAGLANARAGHGVGATWPSVRAIGVPIDHILATRPVQLADFRVHGPIGSDHLPISAVFSLAHREERMHAEMKVHPRSGHNQGVPGSHVPR